MKISADFLQLSFFFRPPLKDGGVRCRSQLPRTVLDKFVPPVEGDLSLRLPLVPWRAEVRGWSGLEREGSLTRRKRTKECYKNVCHTLHPLLRSANDNLDKWEASEGVREARELKEPTGCQYE